MADRWELDGVPLTSEPFEVRRLAHMIPVSRQVLLDNGLVEPTEEERAAEEEWRAEYQRWRRSWRGRWQRFRGWAYAHRPVVHFGACKRCSMCDDD